MRGREKRENGRNPLRICFLTGKYSPGKCGISDYLDLLSRELEKLGHSSRIETVGSNAERSFASLAEKLPECDLMSIQFAPYAFSDNGLSGNDLKRFGAAIKNCRVQVIFHEIWIGDHKGSSVLQKIKGWRQMKEITDFLSRTQPDDVFSTNAANLYRLRKNGVKARYLYLFGNVPHCEIAKEPSTDPSKLTFLFFGTLYDSFPLERMIERIGEIAKKTKRKLKVRVMGRQREEKGIQRLRKLFLREENALEELGEVSVQQASRILNTSDFGISTTPFDAIGKSGATAAMLEHGLPVIAHDDGDTPEEALFSPGPFKERIILLEDTNFSSRLRELLETSKPSFFDGVAYTSETLLRSLATAR